jgi:hypothetical protein
VRRILRLVVYLTLASAPGFSRADDPGQTRFDLHRADGTDVSGAVTNIGEDWSITLDGGKEAIGKAGTLIALRRPGRPLPPPPSEEHLLFMNGDAIPGRALSLARERLHFEIATETTAEAKRQELTVALGDLAALWFSAPGGVGDVQRFWRQLPRERHRKDRIYLRNGDRLDGLLTRIDPESVSLDVEKKPVRLERERVAVIAFNTEFARAGRPRNALGHLVLSNGSRLTLASLRGEGQTWTGLTLTGAAVQIAVDRVVALYLLQGRAVYLSDLKPKNYSHLPYFGVPWPCELDAAVSGDCLLLAGSTYDKGIGMHSESRLTFDLNGVYESFETLVGIDDRAAPTGSAFVDVLVDGKSVAPHSDSEMTGVSPPRSLRLSVAGAHELTLLVKFGRRGDVQGHVDWADARLIKSAGP